MLVGCAAGSVRADVASIPSPSVSVFLPHAYRVLRTYRANLSGGATRDVVVTSVTRSASPWVGADLQVLSWDTTSRRWRLTFDGRSATWPKTAAGPANSNGGPGYPFGVTDPGKPRPILGTLAQIGVGVGPVAFAPLLGGGRDQLVFEASYNAGGGVQGILVVVDFRNGVGKSIFAWDGDTGLGGWRISHNVIHAWANYMDGHDPECCPVRTYRFALSARSGRIVEVADDRPFLGVVLRNTHTGYPAVVLTAPNSPAAGRLLPGDIILRVENALPNRYPLPRQPFEYRIFDTISRFRAGQKVRLLIRRGTKRLIVPVKLGSLMDPAALSIRTPTTDGTQSAL
jgi:hypothetical protein